MSKSIKPFSAPCKLSDLISVWNAAAIDLAIPRRLRQTLVSPIEGKIALKDVMNDCYNSIHSFTHTKRTHLVQVAQ